MIDQRAFEELAASGRQDVLSVSLDVDLTKPDHQRANPAYRIWLREALTGLLERIPRERRAVVRGLISRVLTRVDDHRHGRGLAIFAASDLWREYVLPIPLPNRVHYGQPDLFPLLWALDEYEPYAVLAVDRGQARLLVMYLGQTDVVDQEVLALETGAWRKTSGRSPTFTKRTGTGATRGAQRDTFDARVDEQERRFWRNAAAVTRKTLKDLEIQRLIIAGPPETTAAVAGLLGKDGAAQIMAVVPVPPSASIPQLRALTLQAALAEEHRREQGLVTMLLERLGSRAGAVVGLAATLEALTRGQAQLVIVDPDHQAVHTQPLSELPLLVRRHGAALEMVSGEAARLLAPHDGIGAILRYTTTAEPAGSGV